MTKENIANIIDGQNLFDSTEITEGLRGNVSDLKVDNGATGWFLTNPIMVRPGDNIIINWYVATPYYGHLWLDKDMNIISGTLVNQNNQSFIVPSNAAYIRITGPTTAIQTGKIEYKQTNRLLMWTIRDLVQLMLDKVVNLFNPSKATDGFFMSAYSSGQGINPYFYITDFIPVMPGSLLHVNQTIVSTKGHVWYDQNKNFISASAGNATLYTVPANAYYVRATGLLSAKADMYIYNTPILSTIIERMQLNEYARYAIHPQGTLTNGLSYAAFPGCVFYNGELVAGFRVSAGHTTPTDETQWGGIVIYTRSADGVWTYRTMLTTAGTTIGGELRDPHFTVTRDGKKLLMSGFTTYTDQNKHDNYIIQLNADFTIASYYVENLATAYMWGGVLETPTGYFLHMAYNGSGTYLKRSTATFDGDVSNLGFSNAATFTVQNQQLSEATLGYHNGKLYMIARNDASATAQSYMAFTQNVEGTDGWSSLAPIGIALHAPTLLPVSNGNYLVFAGAYMDHYTSASDRLRYPIIGLIDTATGEVVCYGKIDSDVIGYSGYCGLVKYSGDEYGLVYYEDKGFTSVYYRKVNIRQVCPAIQYLDY